MSWGIAATVGATLVGSAISSSSQKKAANTASNAQTYAAELDIDERRRQFDKIQELLSPYVNAGTGALAGQQSLIGLNGPGAQQNAITALQSSPAFTSLLQSGESAILQNASATGGLRGGNVQAALAQFRPALLAQTINDQYARLGGLTSIGQNAAAGVGNAGLATASGISTALQQQGAAQAGAALAQGKANAGFGSALGSSVGLYSALGGFNRVSPEAQAAYNSIGGISFGGGGSFGGLGSSLSLGGDF